MTVWQIGNSETPYSSRFLDVVHNLFSLMAVEKSPEACARKMSAALAAIAEGV